MYMYMTIANIIKNCKSSSKLPGGLHEYISLEDRVGGLNREGLKRDQDLFQIVYQLGLR